MKTERWVPVVGYEGLYQVSDAGKIKSIIGHHSKSPEIILRPSYCRGYPIVKLHKNRKGTSFSVHRIVLEAFVGLRPSGWNCSHQNNDRGDSRLCNLKWATASENNLMKTLHGTQMLGERHHKAKLTADDVRAIYASRANGPAIKFAKEYSVSRGTVYGIWHGTTWRHLRLGVVTPA